MALRALLVGCGNIGAGYDLKQPARVLTHASAYAHFRIPFDVVEPDRDKAEQVVRRYGARSFASIDDVDLRTYDVVSVATSTSAHAACLSRLLAVGTPLVFCEKPVAATVADVEALRQARRGGRSIVIVNYLRRFAPAYARLREHLRTWGGAAVVRSAAVRYQRGFLNNGGHALDLLEFLFERPVELGTLVVTEAVTDAFADDPTITGHFRFGAASVSLRGVVVPPSGVFEIGLEFADDRIELLDRGDRIVVSRADGRGGMVIDETASENGCIEDYMIPVFNAGLARLDGKERAPDNFEDACRLNVEVLAALARAAGRSAQ